MLPAEFLQSLNGLPGYQSGPFLAVHESGRQVTSVRLHPVKTPAVVAEAEISELTRIPWTTHGYYLPKRPSFTFDPLFHAGCYYVQEASSMLLEEALRQTGGAEGPLRVLDLCAAPGGKSTHLLSLLSEESLLVSNEVIRSRLPVLQDNIIKWGYARSVVTGNDPADFSRLPDFFDIVVVDAPCSGSGLFRRDPEAVEEWSLANVQHCAQRQQRILMDVWPALRPGGRLIYSTCSYSREEDEQLINWLMETTGAALIPLAAPESWGVTDREGVFRCWPDQVQGEGFFLAVLRKAGCEESSSPFQKQLSSRAGKKVENELNNWMDTTGLQVMQTDDTVWCVPEKQAVLIAGLQTKLRVARAGIRAGQWMRDKVIPDHALALSERVKRDIPSVELDREMAVRYLQRQPLDLPDSPRGWTLARYRGFPLGWMNILPGRINNYYPKELRIRKDQP